MKEFRQASPERDVQASLSRTLFVLVEKCFFEGCESRLEVVKQSYNLPPESYNKLNRNLGWGLLFFEVQVQLR